MSNTYLKSLTHRLTLYYSFGEIRNDIAPKAGEPAPIFLPLEKGDIMVFQDSTKHTVSPNPTNEERGAAFNVFHMFMDTFLDFKGGSGL